MKAAHANTIRPEEEDLVNTEMGKDRPQSNKLTDGTLASKICGVLTKHLSFLNTLESVTFNKTIQQIMEQNIKETDFAQEIDNQLPTWIRMQKRVKSFNAQTSQELEKKINDFLGYLGDQDKSAYGLHFLPTTQTGNYTAFLEYEF